MSLHRPATLEDALDRISAGAAPVAGGTDLYPGLRDGPAPSDLVDITAIAGLRELALADGTWRIGAAVSWSTLVHAGLPPLFDGLRTAARAVGSVQIQNAGTVAGNICNASPAADGVPALLALDARVEIAGPAGLRHLPLAEFITGVRRTALAPSELVTALTIPDRPARSAFVKLGARRYLVISIAMVAATVEQATDGTIARAAVAVGACSAVARRLAGLEAALAGRAPDEMAQVVRAAALDELTPIDDIRGSVAYRRDAARTLIARTLTLALGET